MQAVLINRDDMSAEEAAGAIFAIRRRVLDGEDLEEILHNELGFEPDYIFVLL